MEKQPKSRICFVCGIDNPIGLHLAFYTDAKAVVSPASGPNRSTRVIPANCTEGRSSPCWTFQLKFGRLPGVGARPAISG